MHGMHRNDSESISNSPVPRAVPPESLLVMAVEVFPLQTPLSIKSSETPDGRTVGMQVIGLREWMSLKPHVSKCGLEERMTVFLFHSHFLRSYSEKGLDIVICLSSYITQISKT